MKMLHILPLKLFSVDYKQVGKKKKPKCLCTSKMKSGLERRLSPWTEWMMDVGCS